MKRLSAFAVGVVTAMLAFAANPGTPAQSWVEGGVDETSVRAALTSHPSDPVEGIWSATADGARVAIMAGTPPGAPKSAGDSYLLIILRSPRAGIESGTVMGWCSPTARKGYYDSRIFTRCDGRTLSSPKQFTLHLTDDARLSITRVHNGMEIVPWRIIPYMFRRVLRERHDRASELDGFLRLWPAGIGEPLKPRYL